MIDQATRISNSEKLLKGLYNKTMKRVIQQMSQKLKSHPPPKDSETLNDYRRLRDNAIKTLYANQPEDGTEELEEDPDMSPVPSQQNNQSQPHEEGVRQSSPSPNVSDEGDVPGDIEKPMTSPPAEDLDDVMGVDQDQQTQGVESTAFTPLRRPPPRQSAVNKGKQVRRDSGTPDSHNTERASPPPTRKRGKRSLAELDEAFQEPCFSSPDGSDDDIASPPPLREASSRAMTVDAGEGSSNANRMSMTMSPPAQGRRAKKQRQQTRHWTDKELARLKEISPRFKNEGNDLSYKWTKMKQYDEDNGDILRERTALNLKDKIRDIHDKGKHRGAVSVYHEQKRREKGAMSGRGSRLATSSSPFRKL